MQSLRPVKSESHSRVGNALYLQDYSLLNVPDSLDTSLSGKNPRSPVPDMPLGR